jgi:SAM-dependent methyltransferase
MRQIFPWQAYDRLAAAGDYGLLLNENEELALSADGENEAAFFRAALQGRRRVLDVGCGPGFPLIVLAEGVTAVYGVDASPAMLALARRNVAVLRIPNAVLVRGLIEALPFAEGVFDGFAVCGTLGSVPDPAAVLSELARVAAPGAVVASLEQDFRARLEAGVPREVRWLRRDGEGLTLQVVRYLTDPYRLRDERYMLDPANGFCHRFEANLRLARKERMATGLLPEDVLPEAFLDAFYEEEAQFDPATLRESFGCAGFEAVEQHVAISYGVPHIFSVFRHR